MLALDARGGARLAEEARDGVRRCRVAAAQELERDALLELHVRGHHDPAHAPLAEHLVDPVLARDDEPRLGLEAGPARDGGLAQGRQAGIVSGRRHVPRIVAKGRLRGSRGATRTPNPMWDHSCGDLSHPDPEPTDRVARHDDVRARSPGPDVLVCVREPGQAGAVDYPLLALGDQLVAMACIPAQYVVAHIVVAALGIYGFVWLLRLHRSMVALPHVVDSATLRLHRGSLGAAAVSRSDVVSATPIDAEAIARLPEKPGRLDLGGERVLITLRRPIQLQSALRRADARAVVVSADDPAALCAAVTLADRLSTADT